uniref:Parathyroid hormone-like hormone a n=1 Tax=Astatotilapia calliptera TaxID=8154 RepID=A0A3P8R5U6_ASTCA
MPKVCGQQGATQNNAHVFSFVNKPVKTNIRPNFSTIKILFYFLHVNKPSLFLLFRKRSVSHAQLMHDKGRMMMEHERVLLLKALLDKVHTAEIRINLSTTGSTLHSKPPGGTKNRPISFRLEEEEGTNLPQETNKSQTYKDGVNKVSGKKKKKSRAGKRREGEKRKRRARYLGSETESRV